MKIFFDVRMIDHPGIGRYIRGLVSELLKDTQLKLILLGKKDKIQKFLKGEFEVVKFDPPVYSIQEQLGYLKLKNKIGDSLLHIPHYNIPLLVKFNLVVTIHDLTHIFYPQGASSKFAYLYMKFMLNSIVKKAKKIIAVSNYTKKCIERFYPESSSKIKVIYEGVDNNFRKISRLEELENLRSKYHLPERFILYVGSIRRHKNIHTLLEAFSRLRTQLPDIGLVMVGRFSHFIDLEREGVIYLGELWEEEELVGVYNLATLFCNLSLYEGFGLTILEAQATGLPVVCSDIPAHREIGGEGIAPVSPCEIEEIVETLYNVLEDRVLREELILRGFGNLAKFNWSLTAEKTKAIYQSLLR